MTIYQARPLPDGTAELVHVIGTFASLEECEAVRRMCAEVEAHPERVIDVGPLDVAALAGLWRVTNGDD